MLRLAMAITFFYREDRLALLAKIASVASSYSKHTDIFVITNTKSLQERSLILSCFSNTALHTQIITPQWLGHPYLLAWSHLAVFRELIEQGSNHSHYLYLEDDLLLAPKGISYWLEAREHLRPFSLIPGFLRYEIRPSDQTIVVGDITARIALPDVPKVQHEGKVFINLPFPYQAMYLLDQELMREHLASPSSNPDFGRWNIREKAAQALSFWGVPKGFHSRHMLPFDPRTRTIDHRCLVHHMPNNGANDPNSRFGKIPLATLFE
jgi:hypothetical protein